MKLPKIRKALNQAQPPEKEKLTVAQVILKTTGNDITLCPHCKEGKMRTIKITRSPRGSPTKLPIKVNEKTDGTKS